MVSEHFSCLPYKSAQRRNNFTIFQAYTDSKKATWRLHIQHFSSLRRRHFCWSFGTLRRPVGRCAERMRSDASDPRPGYRDDLVRRGRSLSERPAPSADCRHCWNPSRKGAPRLPHGRPRSGRTFATDPGAESLRVESRLAISSSISFTRISNPRTTGSGTFAFSPFAASCSTAFLTISR
jgi:hypothetical protein